ncbi:MAG: hypothetical protein IT519_04800 [Burkholderiales bacterium]|jgi:hypothetical protein|nr:hypothetical protein [Burkholderiales bacterium]
MTRTAKRRRRLPGGDRPLPPPRRVPRDARKVDSELDDALAQTFPASDPVAVDADERERPRK